MAGVDLKVGTTPSTWAWDAGVGQYLRWEYGKRHGTTDAGQVWANNVVILATAVPEGPTAITTGAGNALVLDRRVGHPRRVDPGRPVPAVHADRGRRHADQAQPGPHLGRAAQPPVGPSSRRMSLQASSGVASSMGIPHVGAHERAPEDLR